MVSRSIISSAEGRIPPATIPDTAAPAASVVSNPARSVCTASGTRHEPKRDPGDDAERALRADDDTEEIGAIRVERLAAELDDLAVR